MTVIKTIGKVIIALSFIASLNPYLLLFTIPAFTLGAIAIWISNSKLLAKVLWTVLPILLWYPATFLFMFSYSAFGKATAQKLDFIFPTGFEGKALIIENMPCGQQVKIDGGREQLYIPANGVLLYQGELKRGYVNHKYYKLQPNRQKKQLPERASYMYFDSEKQKPDSKIIGAWLLGSGNGTNAAGVYYSFMELLIASKDSADKYYEFNYIKKFDALKDSLINHCK